MACLDLAVGPLHSAEVREAGLIAFYLPMHTATRLAAPAVEKVKLLNQRAHICCYGLYAPPNEPYLRRLGVGTILGGEFEPALLALAERLSQNGDRQPGETLISLGKLQFLVPDRTDLPSLARYPDLRVNGTKRRVGYTEATRGCKHLCRHCPVVPIYRGAFRVVQHEIVLEDIRRQVAAGAEHITFGDPDFFNGPAHAVRIVRELHAEFPFLTYDVTIKIEHLLRHRKLLPALRDTGCLFVTSAVESVQDEVLEKLDKGHTRQDFIEVARSFRELDLTLSPTFIPFTPWTTWDGYRDLLRLLIELDLTDNVAPIQLALRLLIPGGSRLLELHDIREVLGAFDEAALIHRWRHPDPTLDDLSAAILRLVAEQQKHHGSRRYIFGTIWEVAFGQRWPENQNLISRAAIPYMEEPWYC